MQARPTFYMCYDGQWERLRTVTGDENREDPSHPVFSCSTAPSPLRSSLLCMHSSASMLAQGHFPICGSGTATEMSTEPAVYKGSVSVCGYL